jgi:hypothetical protein
VLLPAITAGQILMIMAALRLYLGAAIFLVIVKIAKLALGH